MINFIKRMCIAFITPPEPSLQEKCADVVLTALEKGKDDITFIHDNIMTPFGRCDGEKLFYKDHSSRPLMKPDALSSYRLTCTQKKRFDKLVQEIYARDEKTLFGSIINQIESELLNG